MELKGDMNLQVTDPAQAHLRITLASPSTDFGSSNLQFKQHPHVAKFIPGQPRVVALKDSSRAFPVGQSLAVLKWRYAGTDESNVPLSSQLVCKSTPDRALHTYFFSSKLLAIAFK
jgi:coatomer subunit delta